MRWTRFWLRGDCGQQVERVLLLGIGSGRERERRLANSGARGAHGVAYDGSHMGEQASETHRRRSVRQLAARHFVECCLRALGRCHRIAFTRLICIRLVLECQRCPGLDHMPLHIVGQHTDENVRLHAAFEAMADRAYAQVNTFQGSVPALDLRQPFVVEHGPLGAHVRFVNASADHVKTVKRRFCCDPLGIEAEAESGIVDDDRSEEHTSELQSRENLVCRLLLEKKKKKPKQKKEKKKKKQQQKKQKI